MQKNSDDNQTTVMDETRQQNDQMYDDEVNKLIEWLQQTPHLPNITGKLFCLNSKNICCARVIPIYFI